MLAVDVDAYIGQLEWNASAVVMTTTGAASVMAIADPDTYEKVVGSSAPGVVISAEEPICWFSPTVYFVEWPQKSVAASGITYNSLGQVTGIRVRVTDISPGGAGSAVETVISAATYDSYGRPRDFVEIRTYGTSGRQYTIRIGNATYIQGKVATFDALVDTSAPVENHAPSDIVLSNARVEENQAPSTVVGVLSGTDPDVGQSATLTFTLVDGFGDNAQFSIDPATRQLRTAATFDYETRNSYSVKVRATDTGSPAMSVSPPPTASSRHVVSGAESAKGGGWAWDAGGGRAMA